MTPSMRLKTSMPMRFRPRRRLTSALASGSGLSNSAYFAVPSASAVLGDARYSSD
ncbi:hypothetical protein HYPSUDRAFT_201367 [Hypholoma sublateritium FD-334 SS-4]|uniref:Uncharacterized protein n=1 Tax=Hypholoma sublateritium (strain FD-334 SS-4) TaxID=945553 RepID=A0A0D2PUR9_HYPSF|nr:hypothetical protein HYPSUDRAFT_201367 [Hypholoma sublateritium FD-334 SS-4]